MVVRKLCAETITKRSSPAASTRDLFQRLDYRRNRPLVFSRRPAGRKPSAIYDEIAVQAGKEVQFSSNTNFIASATKGITFSDGQVHTAKIVYAPGNLQMFLDDLENPIMTVYLNVAKMIPLDNGQAWVGFSAATGAFYQNQDLLSWSFASPANPPASQDPGQSVTSSPIEEAVFSGATTPSITTPLPSDPSFGYALPAGVGLAQMIEASTDLVNWTSVTNANLYFRDPESTNYVQRFYRFRGK